MAMDGGVCHGHGAIPDGLFSERTKYLGPGWPGKDCNPNFVTTWGAEPVQSLFAWICGLGTDFVTTQGGEIDVLAWPWSVAAPPLQMRPRLYTRCHHRLDWMRQAIFVATGDS